MNPRNKTSNTIQALWIGVGSLSSFAFSVLSVAILARYFDKAEYGTYRQILYVYNTLLVIFTAGLPKVFAYYLPRYEITAGKNIVWIISRTLFLAGVAFSIFLFCFSGLIANLLKNPELSIGLKLFSAMPMLLLPTLGIEEIFATYKKTIYIAAYTLSTRVLMLLFIVVPVILFRGTYLHAIYGWIAASVITFFIAYYLKGVPFKNIEKEEKSGLTMKDVLSYSMPLVYASIAGITIRSADQFYISRFFGPEVFAEFANGFIELPFAFIITSATSAVLMPVFSKTFHEKKGIPELILTWRTALNKSALLIYPVVVFCIGFSREIMIILFSHKYETSSLYFQISILLNFFNIVIFNPLFLAMGKTVLYSKVHIAFAVIVWASDYILILAFHNPIAIAIGSTVLNILKILYFIWLASQLLQIRYTDLFPVKPLFKLFIHASFVVAFIKIILLPIIPVESLFPRLLFAMPSYGAILLMTSPFMKIDYLSVFGPILAHFRNAET